ncbi:hypothetical protein [Streptomyces sp. NPDC054887]
MPSAARWNAGDQRWEFHDQDSAAEAGGPPPQDLAESAGQASAPLPSPGADGGPSGARRSLTRPPVPWQPPPPVPTGLRARLRVPRPPFARLPLALGTAVLLVAAGLWFVSGDGDGDGPGEAAGTSPTASLTAPGGYRLAAGPDGSAMAVPAEWTSRLRDDTHVHASRDFDAYVEVGRTSGLLSNLDMARAFSQGVRSVWPGYVERSLAPVGEGPRAAAEVDFEYDDTTSGSRRRGLYRVFTAPNGTAYEVQAAGPSTEWPRQRQVMDTLLSTFHLPAASPSP